MSPSNSSKTTNKMSPSYSSKTNKFSKIWSNFRNWIRYNFCFCKGVLFASGLLFSDKLIDYTILALLATYLLEKEEIEETERNKVKGVTNAVILAMVQEGVSASLEIVTTFISKVLGYFLVISVSSLFYVIGLLLLRLGSEKFEYSRWDITGILLLGVGQAGVKPLIREFIVDQYRSHKPDQENPDEDRAIARKNLWCRVVWSLSALAAFLIYLMVDEWSKWFLVSAVATGSSLILFLCGSTAFYHSGGLADTRMRFIVFLRHLKDFLAKMKGRIREHDRNSSPTPEEQRRKLKGKIWKRWWTTFLLFGLVLSAGKTFFPFQGENMEHSWFLSSLVIIQSISRKVMSYLFESLLSKWVSDPKKEKAELQPEDEKAGLQTKDEKATLVRIWLGMLLSIPCFIIAWRLEVIRRRRIIDAIRSGTRRIDKIIIFWLVPQFCLLGFMEGLAQDGLEEFMIDLLSKSNIRDYASAINTFVIGLGNFINIIGFFVYSKWFGLERLDKYFMTLAIVGSVNLCYYSCLSMLFYHKSKNIAGTSQPAGVDDNTAETDEKGKNKTEEPSQTDGVKIKEKDERSVIDISDANTGDDEEGSGFKDSERAKKDGPDNAAEGGRDQDNPFSCLSDLSACF